MAGQTSKQVAILDDFLSEYSSRLSISGTSKILCFEPALSEVVSAWTKSALAHNDQPAITTLDRSQVSHTSWPHPESSFTHIFAQLSPELKTSVKGLKLLHYSLLWKGIAVVLPTEGNEVAGEKVDIAKLIELGGFEPGKIRVVERSVQVGGERVEGEVGFAMKWDLLTA
jgi:hypothetical protein